MPEPAGCKQQLPLSGRAPLCAMTQEILLALYTRGRWSRSGPGARSKGLARLARIAVFPGSEKETH